MPTGLVSTRLASTRLARILFLLFIGNAAADSYEIPPLSSAPQGAVTRRDVEVEHIAVFTLIRGGASESDYEMFRNSRECVHDVMAGVQYDNIAFHEGNVPAVIHTKLGQKMYVSFELRILEFRLWNSVMNDAFVSLYRYRLSFMNVHDHGGFPEG
eukprot:6335625-Prymnesium_polylepis.1